jgi:gamma-glutamyltranspeptidase / glutathione hydrolase
MRYLLRTVCATMLLSSVVQASPIIMPDVIFTPVQGKNGMVVTGNQMASEIGREVLKQGGNAVDAAVTVGFVMSVTFPQAGNIGGGGFMLIHPAKEKKVIAIDYREKAPAKASRDMFLDANGKVDKARTRFSPLSAGVPGTVAGMAMALEKYGTWSLAQALAPAIKLAEEGFIVSRAFSESMKGAFKTGGRAKNLKTYPATAALFLKADGGFYEAGDRFVQKDLANTLKIIANDGVDGFYRGKIAQLIAQDMQKHGGLITIDDLAAYQAQEREPIEGSYRGYEIYSMSPPSSGGTHIVQMLNSLEGDDIQSLGHNAAATIHLMAEVMKRAYADRSEYLGDSDFVCVPLKALTSKTYATQLREQINPSNASDSSEIQPGQLTHQECSTDLDILSGQPTVFESEDTTHYSVVDQAGNMVSNTYSVNFSYGAGIVIEGTGMLINNTMDDFSASPGKLNAYGLLGGEANAIAPNKRPLSSMSPTIVLKNGKPFLITGSPGGSKIITTALQVIMNVIDHQMNIQEAVNAVRIHHQWLPDKLEYEKGLSLDTLRLLKGMGHNVVKTKRAMGAASSILIHDGVYYGAGDPRRFGVALGY